MINNFADTLMRHRWMAVAAFALLLASTELTLHYVYGAAEFNQIYRVLLFGVALPLLAAIAFSVPTGLEKTRRLASRTKETVKQRVLVATQEMLLGAGIEGLLIRQKDLDLVGVTSGSGPELIKKITRLQPEVVILDEMMYLSNAENLMSFFGERPEVRFVVVSANENRVQVVNKRQIQVMQSSNTADLVDMMCHN